MIGVAIGQLFFGPLSDLWPTPRRPRWLLCLHRLFVPKFARLEHRIDVDRSHLSRCGCGGSAVMRHDPRHLRGDRGTDNGFNQRLYGFCALFSTLGALITVELGWRFTFIAQAIFAAAVLLGLASFRDRKKS